MKKLLLFILFTTNAFTQVPQIDNTFNSSETGVYQQNIGRNGVLLANNKILTSIKEDIISSKVILLNADGSLDNSFNSSPSYITSTSQRIFPKSDGKFITFSGAWESSDAMKFRSFNADGTINTNFTEPILGGPTSGMTVFVTKIIYQEDGKIIIVGRFNLVNNLPYKNIVRLNNDGSIDTSFSVGSGFSNQVECISIQSDGKYVVGGDFNSYNGTSRGKIARLNTNGSIDTTFNLPRTLDGTGSVSNGLDAPVYDVKIQTNGKIIIIGSVLRSNGSIVSRQITRLNADGTRDTSFTYNFNTYNFRNVLILNDGKIIASTLDSPFIKRFNSNGTADNTFSYSNNAGFIDYEGIMYLQGTNILVVGDYQGTSGITRYGVHRITSNGSLDLTFNPHAGPNFFDISSMENIQTIDPDIKAKVLLDQKILLAGSFTSYNDIPCRKICRITQNGDFDNTFQLDPNVQIYTSINDKNKIILQQNDGKIILSFNNSFNPLTHVNNIQKDIIRLNNNGTLDNTFNFIYNNCGITDIKLTSDGKMLAIGSSNIFKSSSKFKVVRFNLDGSIDTSFTSILLDQLPNSIDLQSDNKILISFTNSNTSLWYVPIIRLNDNGTQDSTFNINVNGGKHIRYVKSLSNNKILVTYNLPNTFNNYSYIDRLNSDGTPDNTFNRYTNTIQSGYYPIIKLLENEKILAYATDGTTPLTNRSLFILNPDGVLQNTFTQTQNISESFDIQNCSNIILYGFFNKINNANKNNIVRFGLPLNDLTPSPTGEVYQSFSNGQTLANLVVTGNNILWYDEPGYCSINNNTTNRNTSRTNSPLPDSTPLVNGTTYYASQTLNNIESINRLPVTVYSTLGIDDYNTLDNVNIFPNPIANNLTLTNSSIIEKVEIYSLVGQKILDKKTYDKIVNIDFSNYNSGIYLIRIFSEDKSKTYKLIKK